MAVLLGVLVALAFGSGDFLGARAAERTSVPGALVVSQVAAVVGAIGVAVSISAHVEGRDIAYGAAAGSLNVIGLGLLYLGLSRGRMGIVAPIAAVVGAVVPITWGLIDGERPSGRALVGVALAVLAGGLIARASDDADIDGAILDGRAPRPDGWRTAARGDVVVAVAAGFGFGSSFVCFAETSPASGYWPVLAARSAAVVVVGVGTVIAMRFAPVVIPSGRSRWLALLAGALDVTATTLLLVAVRRGLTVVVAPVASLATAVTVVLAWRVLREKVGRAQVVGLAVAMAGLALIASG